MREFIGRHLPPPKKQYILAQWLRAKKGLVRRMLSYTPAELETALVELGLRDGDTLLMNSGFDPFNGIQGEPGDVIDSVLRVIGPSGNLFMMSLPYQCSSLAYLRSGEVFDVRKTISRMGMITEVFRRRPGVLRSLNPLHPIVGLGPKAAGVLAGHEKTLHSCGPESPFARMMALDARVLLFGVPFRMCSFQHHLEHVLREELPFDLYLPQKMEATIIDYDGRAVRFETLVFDPRNYAPLVALMSAMEAELVRTGRLSKRRLGNTRLQLARTEDLLRSFAKVVRAGAGIELEGKRT